MGKNSSSLRSRAWLQNSLTSAFSRLFHAEVQTEKQTVLKVLSCYYGCAKYDLWNGLLLGAKDECFKITAVLTGWKCLFQQICVVVFSSILFFFILQFGVSEDELGSPEEVHQWSDQQSKRFQHRQHYSRAAAGEYCEGQVKTTALVFYSESERVLLPGMFTYRRNIFGDRQLTYWLTLWPCSCCSLPFL